MFTSEDYDKAIEALQQAKKQLKHDGNNCAYCGDTDHQAWECRFNPLVKVTRAEVSLVQDLFWMTVAAATILKVIDGDKRFTVLRATSADFSEAYDAVVISHANAAEHILLMRATLKEKYGIDLSRDVFQ